MIGENPNISDFNLKLMNIRKRNIRTLLNKLVNNNLELRYNNNLSKKLFYLNHILSVSHFQQLILFFMTL